jgi:hypothetical protein
MRLIMYDNTDPQPASAPRLDVKLNPERGPDRRTLAIVEAVNSAVERLVDAVADAEQATCETIVEAVDSAVERLVDAVADVEQAIRETKGGDKQNGYKPDAPWPSEVYGSESGPPPDAAEHEQQAIGNQEEAAPEQQPREHEQAAPTIHASEVYQDFLVYGVGSGGRISESHAYGRALRKAGYKTFEDIAKHKGETSAIADKIFGRIEPHLTEYPPPPREELAQLYETARRYVSRDKGKKRR